MSPLLYKITLGISLGDFLYKKILDSFQSPQDHLLVIWKCKANIIQIIRF